MNRLVAIAVLSGLIGLCLAAFWTEDPTIAGRAAAVAVVLREAFGYGFWGWASRGAIVSLGLAVTLTAVDAIVNRVRPVSPLAFDALTGENLRERIREVQARVGSAVRRSKPDIVA